MNSKSFNSIKPGDTVTLSTQLHEYYSGFYIPADQMGTVTAVKVPAVRGRERYFVCVDFPMTTPLRDNRNRPEKYPYKYNENSRLRVGAFREDLK
jgi:hypothetical protein